MRAERGVRRRTALARESPELEEYTVSGERGRVGVVGERIRRLSSDVGGPSCESPRRDAEEGPRKESEDGII